MQKQMFMMRLILAYYDAAVQALDQGANAEAIEALPVREAIGRFKYVPEDKAEAEFEAVSEKLKMEIAGVLKGGER
jgi:V/A-type H+-transporting ATPase subunit A